MKQSPIVVFDALGTVQGYTGTVPDSSGYMNHKRFYQEMIAADHGLTVEEMLRDVPYETQREWTVEEVDAGRLIPRTIDGIERVIGSYKRRGIHPVIMTADNEEGARRSTRTLVESGLIDEEDVYAINHCGSKKDPRTWRKAQGIYIPDADIVAVYEDTPANLEAACEAYDCEGYLVTDTSEGVKVQKQGEKDESGNDNKDN